MSDELDDAKEFANVSGTAKPSANRRSTARPTSLNDLLDDMDGTRNNQGQPVQYSLHSDGYAATTPTIKTLPAGCYDIKQDNRAIFASPTIAPSGLLLELPEMKSEKVIEVIETFWASEDDYKIGNEFIVGGASYRGGCLLFGPPGSGKSCSIKLVAKKMVERGGTVFYASIHPIAIVEFLTSFSKIESNRKCVVVLEDLDTLIDNFGESHYLEMLDSAKTIDNVFFIATTNYPEKLDPRIYSRPGRFSHVIKIGNPTLKAREAYLRAVLKNTRDLEYILDNTSGFSIDHLSSLISAVYREKKELVKEIERLRLLYKAPKIDEKSLGFGLNVNNEDEE